MKNASILPTLLILTSLFFGQTAQAQWSNGASVYVQDPTKKVGIGTTNPTAAKLEVEGAIGNTVALFRKASTGKGLSIVSDWPGIYFNASYNGGVKSMAAGYSGIVNFDPDLGRFDIGVTATAAAAANATVDPAARMTINKDGNVAIGGPSNAKLGVTSNLKTSLDNTMTWSNPTLGPNMSHVHFGLKGDWYIRSAANDGVVNIQDNAGRVFIGGPSNAKVGVTSNLKTTLDNTMTWSNPALGPNMSHVHFGLKGDWYIRSAANDGVVNIQDNAGRVCIGGPSNAKVGVTSNLKTNLDNTMTWSNPALGPNMSHAHFGLKGDWYIRSAANNGVVVLQDNAGGVGIGTANVAGFKLAVNGIIRAKEIRVQTGWADYVFADDYTLRPLDEVETFIKANKHLPDIQPAAEIQENGLDVAATTTKMMVKIEELTLYLIDLKKENDALKARVNALEKQ